MSIEMRSMAANQANVNTIRNSDSNKKTEDKQKKTDSKSEGESETLDTYSPSEKKPGVLSPKNNYQKPGQEINVDGEDLATEEISEEEDYLAVNYEYEEGQYSESSESEEVTEEDSEEEPEELDVFIKGLKIGLEGPVFQSDST